MTDVTKPITMKDNILIAEFMGWELQDNPTDRWYGSYREPNGVLHRNTDKEPLLFHTSWDWLMPVHKKCMFTPNFSGDDQLRTLLIDAVIDADINRLYDAVVEFIKEYNNV